MPEYVVNIYTTMEKDDEDFPLDVLANKFFFCSSMKKRSARGKRLEIIYWCFVVIRFEESINATQPTLIRTWIQHNLHELNIMNHGNDVLAHLRQRSNRNSTRLRDATRVASPSRICSQLKLLPWDERSEILFKTVITSVQLKRHIVHDARYLQRSRGLHVVNGAGKKLLQSFSTPSWK